jgi:hypothetical protein
MMMWHLHRKTCCFWVRFYWNHKLNCQWKITTGTLISKLVPRGRRRRGRGRNLSSTELIRVLSCNGPRNIVLPFSLPPGPSLPRYPLAPSRIPPFHVQNWWFLSNTNLYEVLIFKYQILWYLKIQIQIQKAMEQTSSEIWRKRSTESQKTQWSHWFPRRRINLSWHCRWKISQLLIVSQEEEIVHSFKSSYHSRTPRTGHVACATTPPAQVQHVYAEYPPTRMGCFICILHRHCHGYSSQWWAALMPSLHRCSDFVS